MFCNHSLYREDVQAAAGLSFIPWKELHGTSVLITGATGLIGTALIDILMEHNRIQADTPITVYALGRSRERLHHRFADYEATPYFHYVVQDIRDPLPDDLSFTYMINGASNAHPAAYAKDPVGTILINIQGLSSLLSHAVTHGTKRVLEISSIEVYGQNRGDVASFDETYCGYIDCNTTRAGYPESKRVCEALCQSYRSQYGLEVCLARPSRVYGPTMLPEDNKATAQFIHNVLRGEDIVLKSDGKQRYSYTYMLDVATAFLTILLKGEDGQAYNVADPGSGITLGALAEKMAEQNHCHVRYEIPSHSESAGFSHLKDGVMNAGKLESLGWRAMVSLEDGIQKTIQILSNSDASGGMIPE